LLPVLAMSPVQITWPPTGRPVKLGHKGGEDRARYIVPTEVEVRVFMKSQQVFHRP
jgi:hypothetical protein